MKPRASHSSHQTATTRRAARRACFRAILLATSALASAALSTTIARADDATWTPTGNNFNSDLNWRDGNNAPSATPSGTATFVPNTAIHDNITFTVPTPLGGITLAPGAGEFSFDNGGNSVTLSGAGFSVGSGSSLIFTVSGSVLEFSGDTATAGQATINVAAPGTLNFNNKTSAGSAIITNDGRMRFFNGSSAAQAQIANNLGARVTFDGDGPGGDNSTAANATITNHGTVDFGSSSKAENASIKGDGSIFFDDASDGGKARIALETTTDPTTGNVATGTLDISGHLPTIVSIGSLEGNGTVLLGANTLAVGGNNMSTVFAGAIRNGNNTASHEGDIGSLTKEGSGSLTLTGTENNYTGTTTINGGALIVDGDITSSPSVIVNAGGTLAGTGFVSNVTIIDGGTLAPGHGDVPGRLNIDGNLTFSQGATYRVQFSDASGSKVGIGGSATLGGATVAANFVPGATVTRQQYNILQAVNPITDTFNPLVKSNLSPIFKVSLSYDPTDVFLNVNAAPLDASSGFNTNQRNVGNALVNVFNTTGSLPGAFALLSPQSLTQVSGETAVGTQQATFDAMNQFMGVLLDPTLGVRGGQPKDALASMPRKAGPLSADAFDSRWGVWAAGFGGSQSTSGDTNLGSNKTTSNVFGSAVGVDYRFSPDTVLGFALAGGGTHFNVANGGSGNSDLFQAGAYLRHSEGAAFIAAALAYGWQDVTTNRTVTAFGIDSLRANFKTNAISGRLEGGYKVATAVGDITPYAAAQFTNYRLPSYMEQVAFGAGTFALNYAGKDVTATRSELGLRGEKAVPLTDATLMLRGRLAWAHDFNTDRNVQATFQSLPGSAFVVNGATPAADTALTTVSAETLWRNGWSASITADAQLSDTTHSYSGKGVVRYNW
jgi:autotransporter-associated beta strand protein